MTDPSATNAPRTGWALGTLALAGLCLAGMVVGALLALRPAEPELLVPKRFRPDAGPPQVGSPAAIQFPPGRDDPAPRSSGTDAAGPRSR